jgi:glutathione S-transferase
MHMQIHYSPTSPYARKVRAVAIEKQIDSQIEWIAVDPFVGDAALDARNPLGKVPVLMLENGRCLFDSRVICEYLDAIGQTNRLLPENPIARSEVATRQALADGVMDAAFMTVMERRRPSQERSQMWLARWSAAIRRALLVMDHAERPADRFDLGDLACAVSLGYLDFRLPEQGWRAEAPSLAVWHTTVAGRPSLMRSAPPQA